jgi:predicted ATPase
MIGSSEAVVQQQRQPVERRLNLSGTKIYGRDKELGTIRRAVERATSGSHEIILLEGPSGVGKSSLAKKLFAQNHKTCLFGSGKFAASSDAPFAAIISPFDEIIIFICQDERLRATIVSCIKQELTANDRSTLVQFIPVFHMLMDDDDDDESLGGLSSSTEDAILVDRKDLSTKIKFSLRGFLRVLSNHSRRVVVLCFLDLQFADIASMDVLDFIANDDDQIHFMVLATYCSREISADHRVSTWKAKASNITAETTTTLTIIALEYLMVDQINTFSPM